MTRARRASSILGAVCLAVSLSGASAAPAAGRLPPEGVLRSTSSLGGLALGVTRAGVKARWGSSFGRCRSCVHETWYYTYRPFEPQGAAVEYDAQRRVRRIYTLFRPSGWRTADGLELGATEQAITDRYGSLPRKQCLRYTALLLKGLRAWAVLYVYDGTLWGFGLTRPEVSPCV